MTAGEREVYPESLFTLSFVLRPFEYFSIILLRVFSSGIGKFMAISKRLKTASSISCTLFVIHIVAILLFSRARFIAALFIMMPLSRLNISSASSYINKILLEKIFCTAV